MWKRKQANVDVTILKMFYSSVVLSVMTYCVSLFYEALYYSDKSKLNRICSIAQRIMVYLWTIYPHITMIDWWEKEWKCLKILPTHCIIDMICYRQAVIFQYQDQYHPFKALNFTRCMNE